MRFGSGVTAIAMFCAARASISVYTTITAKGESVLTVNGIAGRTGGTPVLAGGQSNSRKYAALAGNPKLNWAAALSVSRIEREFDFMLTVDDLVTRRIDITSSRKRAISCSTTK